MLGLLRTFGASGALHLLVFLGLLSVHFQLPKDKPRVEVISSVVEPTAQEDLVESIDLDSRPLNLDASVMLMPKGLAQAGGGMVAALPERSALTTTAVASTDFAAQRRLERPLSGTTGKLDLGGNVVGLRGASLASSTDGGSVDRITQEILRQLDKGQVLVVWVLDASGSLALRRQQVVDRFERVYKELGQLGKNDDVLMGAVVAFGQSTVFMNSKPTSNSEELSKAVRAIKTDDSGKENVFTAVREAALKYRRYQTHGRRSIMMIVLTDETGDDPSLLDDAVSLVQRNRVPVYVLGPMAPFGRRQITVTVVDKPTGEAFSVPVERGPESFQSEHLAVPFWSGNRDELLNSGFGPYALTRLARDSGGIYFLFDDNRIGGPKFDIQDLLVYSPEYLSTADYRKMLSRHPLRAAVVKAVEESKDSLGAPPMAFAADSLNNRMQEAQRQVAKTAHFVGQAVSELRAVAKDRPKEPSKRWQAHYDLMMGRLLAVRVRSDEYNWVLSQMRSNPKSFADKKNNSWRLVGDNEIAFGKKNGPNLPSATNVKKSDPRATQRAKEDSQAALDYLQRVIKEHPKTPWAYLANRELATPLGFRWEEYYSPPPPKEVAQTPAMRKSQEERNRRRAEAEKRVGRL